MLSVSKKSFAGKMLGVALASLSVAGVARAEVKLQVAYSNASVFKAVQEDIAAKFMAQQPNIKIEFRNPATSYEELAQQLMRDKITNSLPDVAFNGINQLGLFVDQKLPVALDTYAQADGGMEKLGYQPALTALGKKNGKQYGVPFGVSMPLVYVNTDLLAKAGQDAGALTSWPAIVAAGQAVDQKIGGTANGFYFDWEQTGNWLFQSLVTSNGGKMLADNQCDIAFDDAHGMAALKTLESFHAGGMKNLGQAAGRQAFVAGNVGIWVSSSGFASTAEKMIGDKFKLKTLAFPVGEQNPHLPGGGAMVMVLSTDNARQKAAWEYVKFATGGVGQAIMAQGTGYMPVNEAAVNTPELMGNYYKQFPNQAMALKQLPLLTEWVSYPGSNSLKMIEVIKGYTEGLINGSKTAEQTMPALVKDVRALLPQCSSGK
ncbi:MAG TPA: extracellular solute-binding protein [Azospirillum sp.]|nr:extracellular solute-binding protein [Azospirillum sp.]